MNLISKVLPSIPRRLFGQNWTARDSVRAWKKIVISGDGKIQAALVTNGQIYVSTNSGQTWAAKETAQAWSDIVISYNGQTIAATVDNAASGGIYVSSNFGSNWQLKAAAGNPALTGDFKYISMSLTGQYMTALTDAEMYRSSDFGNTWIYHENNQSGPIAPWTTSGSKFRNISLSATGQIQAVGTSLHVFVSNDSGNNWAKTSPDLNRETQAIVSANGSKLFFTGQRPLFYGTTNRSVYVSSDSGLTWSEKQIASNLQFPATSETGQFASVATNESGVIYVTSNFGVTWTWKPPSGNNIAISANGKIQICRNWLSLDFGNTWVYNSSYPNQSLVYISADGTTGAGLSFPTSQIYTAGRTRI